MIDSVYNWVSENYVEIFGTLSGLIYLIFSIKQKIWLWPLGILTSSLYIYVFFREKFYADMGLQVYYVLISIYGWYHWFFGKRSKPENELPVSTTSGSLALVLILVTGFLFVFMGYVLDNFTDSPLPYWDSFTTSASIVATWMLARKKLEQWLVWVVVDAVSLGLYVYKEMHPTVLLFAVYTSMAAWGYIEWKKAMKYSGNDK